MLLVAPSTPRRKAVLESSAKLWYNTGVNKRQIGISRVDYLYNRRKSLMLKKTFGCKKDNMIYKERTGAYGIGFSADGKVPVAMTHLYNGDKGYFLLGGGIENNENHKDCIIRETLEEAGLAVVPTELVCMGDYYHFIEQTKTDFHGIGYFYYMEIGDVISAPTEPDHYLAWLTIDEIKEKLFLPHQIWAVEQAYNMFVK